MGVFTTQGYRGKLVDKTTGTILDTFKDEDIKISNNILELFDLGEIPGTYTQQITLPGTKLNNNFFEHYYDISVYEPDLFNTNQVVEAYLDFDGIYLVNGYLQLNRVNVLENKFVDSYECTLFGIVSNFSIDTRAAFLTDITSLSAYNHTSSLANISSSWNKQLFNGDIVYPMAEYGSSRGTNLPTIYYSNTNFLGIDDSEGALCVQDFKPAIRLKKVWDAIFTEFGYTYTGSFWNQAWLNNVYLICNNDLRTPVYQPSIETYLQAQLTNVSASGFLMTANVSSSFPVNSKVYDYNNAYTLTGGTFFYTAPITTKFEAKLNLAFQVSKSAGAGSGMPQFYITYENGSGTVVNTQALANLNTQLGTIASSRATTVTETFNIKDYIFTIPPLDSGSSYYFKIWYSVQGTNNFTVTLNPTFNDQSSITFLKAKQAADGKIIDIPSNMPFGTSGIRVIDFIRSIQKRFNLIIYPDKTNPNQFVVETFNTWYKNGQIKDFNKFINLTEKISYTPANQLGYRKVRFSDADDTDYIETLFKRTNNRVYGESNFYDSGSYYSQGSFEVLSDVVASGPLVLVPGSGYTGSAANQTCTTYIIRNVSDNRDDVVYYSYTACNGAYYPDRALLANRSIEICAQTDTLTYYVDGDPNAALVSSNGDCSPPPVGGSSTYPIWIPYYISDANYNPARVLPRIFFYNDTVQASPYFIEGYTLPNTSSITQITFTKFPYFDNYSSGSVNGTASFQPTVNAASLLYNNEQAVWGSTPTGSLVSTYWSTYLSLLYNPRTRLVEASAVIPLADYFDIELNDIAEFRGSYYHLRAINDYNLTTGECNVQLLGPLIPDTISGVLNYSGSVDLCSFNFTASVVTCTTWDGSPFQWDTANVLWNCVGVGGACNRYDVQNPSALTRYFDYTDCSGSAQTLTLSSFQQTQVCGLSYTDNTELIITLSGSC